MDRARVYTRGRHCLTVAPLVKMVAVLFASMKRVRRMIETKTTWKDSGYDCDHCGGQILKRTDRETGQQAQVCYQCQMCGCQWELGGEILRIGNMNSCQQAIKNQEAVEVNPARLRLIFVVVGLVLIGLIFLGGLVAVRFLVPVAIAVFVFRAVYLLGKERMWW